MIRLLFTCRLSPEHSSAEVEAAQRETWRKCTHRAIGGFFVRDDDILIGLFEGAQRDVLSCVEGVVRKKPIVSVHVVDETEIEGRGWMRWHGGCYGTQDLRERGVVGTPDLDHLLKVALRASGRTH